VPRPPVYRSDPGQAPDSAFEAGKLSHLVAGNTGRMLDARRTPVRIVSVDPRDGMFEVEICAFEDAGARWRIPLEEAGGYQFAHGSERVGAAALAELRDACARLDRTLLIEANPERARASERLAAAQEARAARWLSGRLPRIDLAALIAAREGDRRVMGLLEEYLQARGLADMDSVFSRAFVTNPAAGETVKGHAIVLAELGLAPYTGKIVRGADVFTGQWSRERRAEHLLTRLGFSRALWGVIGRGAGLYRAYSSETALRAPRKQSFVSATFSRDLALEHFGGGPATRAAAISRTPLDPSRVLMTFLESEAMNRQYREAEAVLVGSAPEPGL
jgi:hypothetical protein